MPYQFNASRAVDRARLVGQAGAEEEATNFVFEGLVALEAALDAGEDYADLRFAIAALRDGLRKRYARIVPPSNSNWTSAKIDACAAHDFNDES